jgi:hypothetical protein
MVKKALGEDVMSMVNDTIKRGRGRPPKVVKERTIEEVKQILPEVVKKVEGMIQQKQKKPERSLNLELEPEPPKTPEKKAPKITQRVIHQDDSEPEEIIEEVIIKKKKKPIVRRKIVYADSSDEEEEEAPKRKTKVIDPVSSMTHSEIQNEMRRIQMEMLSKSLFGA